MIIHENRPHKLAEYLQSEVFRNRRSYMSLCPKKNTKDNLYNSIALNLTYDGRIIANDSVKFQQYTCTAQKDHLIINPVVYEWQRLN